MKIISGKVSYRKYLNFLTGNFRIGNYTVKTGNMIILFMLRNSKWAKVMVNSYNEVVRILDRR